MTGHYLITLNISLVDAFKKEDFTFLETIKSIYQNSDPYQVNRNEISPKDDDFKPLGGPVISGEDSFEFSYFVFVSFYIDYYLTNFKFANKDFEKKLKGFFDVVYKDKLKRYFENSISQIGFSTSLLKNLYAFYNAVPYTDDSPKEEDTSDFWNFTTNNKYAKGRNNLFSKEYISSYWLYAYLKQNINGWATLARTLATKDGLYEEQNSFYLAYAEMWHDPKKNEFKEDALTKGYFDRIGFSVSTDEDEYQQKIKYLEDSFHLYWTNSISMINRRNIEEEVKELNDKLQDDVKILNDRFSGRFTKKSSSIKQGFEYKFLRRFGFGIPDLIDSASKQLDLSKHNNIFYILISEIFKGADDIKKSITNIDGNFYQDDDIEKIATFNPDEKDVFEPHYIQSERIVTERDNKVLDYMKKIPDVEGLSLYHDTYLKNGAIKFNITDAQIPNPRKLNDDEIKTFLRLRFNYDKEQQMYIEPLSCGITLSFTEDELISLFRNNLYEYQISITYNLEFDLDKILIYTFTERK